MTSYDVASTIHQSLSRGYSAEGYAFMFTSPGLLDVTFGVTISEGAGYALKVETPTAFTLPATSQDTFRSAYVTQISSPLETTVGGCRLTPDGPWVDRVWFQRLNLKYLSL